MNLICKMVSEPFLLNPGSKKINFYFFFQPCSNQSSSSGCCYVHHDYVTLKCSATYLTTFFFSSIYDLGLKCMHICIVYWIWYLQLHVEWENCNDVYLWSECKRLKVSLKMSLCSEEGPEANGEGSFNSNWKTVRISP